MTEKKEKKFVFKHQAWKPGEEQPKVAEVDLAKLERLEQSREHLEEVRKHGQIGHFQTRPHAGVMLGNMYTAMMAELSRLKEASLHRTLDATEFKRMIDIANSLPKVMREEREQNKQEQEELDHLSKEDLAKQLREYAEELEGGYIEDSEKFVDEEG